MPLFEIRTARLEDAADLARLSAELGYPSDESLLRERLEAIAARDDHALFIATESGGAPLGWIHVFLARRVESAPFAEIGGLVVTQRERRSGVGRQLTQRAEEWARRQGVSRLRVRTRVERDDACAFYLAEGFVETKRQRVLDKDLDKCPPEKDRR